MAVQPDGRIILGGVVWGTGTFRLALARYTANGSLDPTFGSGGKLVTGIDVDGGNQAQNPDIVLQPDGRIVVSGSHDGVGLWVARYNPNGTPDTTFGGGTGRVTTEFPTGWRGPAGWQSSPSGHMVVTGTSEDLSTGLCDVTLARYTADGRPDASFGNGGIKIVPTPQPGPDQPANRFGADVAVQGDGRIITCGPAGDGTGAAIGFAMRLDSDGAIDIGYGTDGTGVVEMRIAGRTGRLNAVAIQSDGKALFAGDVTEFATPGRLI